MGTIIENVSQIVHCFFIGLAVGERLRVGKVDQAIEDACPHLVLGGVFVAPLGCSGLVGDPVLQVHVSDDFVREIVQVWLYHECLDFDQRCAEGDRLMICENLAAQIEVALLNISVVDLREEVDFRAEISDPRPHPINKGHLESTSLIGRALRPTNHSIQLISRNGARIIYRDSRDW